MQFAATAGRLLHIHVAVDSLHTLPLSSWQNIIYYYYLLTAIEFSLGGSSPYTSTDKTNKNIHKRNNPKSQYKQYKNSDTSTHITKSNKD